MRSLVEWWEPDGGEGGKSPKPAKCIVLGDTAIFLKKTSFMESNF